MHDIIEVVYSSKMRRVALLTFLLVISSSFATARADLKSQYNKGGCQSYYKIAGTNSLHLCIDGNNIVYLLMLPNPMQPTRQGKVGAAEIKGGLMSQYEIGENGDLIEYTCDQSYGECTSAIRMRTHKRVIR